MIFHSDVLVANLLGSDYVRDDTIVDINMLIDFQVALELELKEEVIIGLDLDQTYENYSDLYVRNKDGLSIRKNEFYPKRKSFNYIYTPQMAEALESVADKLLEYKYLKFQYEPEYDLE
jgi:hypothetical protein